MRTLVESYIGKYEDMGDPGENNFGHIQVYVPKSAAANGIRSVINYYLKKVIRYNTKKPQYHIG